MSGGDDDNAAGNGKSTDNEQREDGGTHFAEFRPSRWPGLIWAVPIAALVIVGWLGIRAYIEQGPSVTVTFETTGGVEASHTSVKYRGKTVGHVTAVHLAKSLSKMTVKLTFERSMEGHLGKGTRFWIGGGSLSLTNLASIKSLISGPYIGVSPHSGQKVSHFQGLSQPPVLRWEVQGETFTLIVDNPGNVGAGAPVYFRHKQVGEVRGVRMRHDGRGFRVLVFVHKKYAHLVTDGTRFWKAGAVHLALGGNGPTLRLESVPALVSGAVAFITPPGGKPAKNGATFTLYPGRNAAETAPGRHAVPYRVVFAGGPHGLAEGAAVMLEGTPAGIVTGVHAVYDPAKGAIHTEVLLALEPRKIGRPSGHPWHMKHPAPQMTAMLKTLIGNGLRARLGSALPVVGGKVVDLALVPGSEQAALTPGEPPTIPSIGGGGTQRMIAQVSDILTKINAMPLAEIADNIHTASKRLAALSGSAKTRQTLEKLERTVSHLDAISRETSADWPTILREVKASAREAKQSLAATKALLARTGSDANGPESTTVPRAMYELTRAARSLRELSNYLQGHPNSVIFGRGH